MSASHLTVLQVGASNSDGGAEKVMSDLHHAYMDRGVDSWVAVGTKHGSDSHVVEIPNEASRSPWTRTLSSVAKRVAGDEPRGARWLSARLLLLASAPVRYARVLQGQEDYSYPGTTSLLDLLPTSPDVLHLHNLHSSYFDLRQLPSLSASVPTVLTLHDAWLLTGHCAHPMECPRWQGGCGQCPRLDIYVPISRDASARNWRLKRDIVRQSRLRIATPSHWLMEMVERSGIADGLVERRVIHNGVDTTVYRPGSRSQAREALGLPQDRRIVLFVGRGLRENPWKDWATLELALPEVTLADGARPLLVGLGAEGGSGLSGDVLSVPFVDDSATVARYFQAADLYVHPARAENLPLAVLEAMACGTPVVASRVGGIPEAIVDGETGVLVSPGDSTSLAHELNALLADDARLQAFSDASVRRVRAMFTLEAQVEAYLDWYSELLGRGPASV